MNNNSDEFFNVLSRRNSRDDSAVNGSTWIPRGVVDVESSQHADRDVRSLKAFYRWWDDQLDEVENQEQEEKDFSKVSAKHKTRRNAIVPLITRTQNRVLPIKMRPHP